MEKKFSDFYKNPEEKLSRQGRKPCPINEAERNGLFCKFRKGRAKQILGKHYLFWHESFKITKSEKEKWKNQKKIFSDSEKIIVIILWKWNFFFFFNLKKIYWLKNFSFFLFYACQTIIFEKNRRVDIHLCCLLF